MMKILVVRYRFIGDTILTIPFLRNLRYKYPDARIDMLVAPNSGEAVANCPYVDNFIYFDTTRKHKYEKGNGEKKSFLHYVSILRKEKYNKAYILKRSFSSAMLCFLAGIKERIGFDSEFRGFLLTKRVKYDTKKHESLCFLDVLENDGIKIKDTYLENWIKEENKNRVDNLLLLGQKTNVWQPPLQTLPLEGQGGGEKHTPKLIAGIIKKNKIERFAIVNAAASNVYKMWDLENFAIISEYILNEKGLGIIFIGAKSDYELYEKINSSGKFLNLCGELSIQDSLALIKRAEFLLGNDSGSLHMASSVGTKVIGLYGAMPFEKWRALGEGNILLKADLPCIPCSLKRKCKNNKACMKAIDVETVKKAVDEMLKE